MKKVILVLLFLLANLTFCLAQGELKVTVDKDSYQVGEGIKINIKNECDYRVGADYNPYGMDFVVLKEGSGDNFEGVISKKRCSGENCFEKVTVEWLNSGDEVELEWQPQKSETSTNEFLGHGTYKVGIKYPSAETGEGIKTKIAFSQKFIIE